MKPSGNVVRKLMGRQLPERDDRGESLVELLVSMSVLGIAGLAILGAVGMASTTSAVHEQQAKSQNLVRNWAEKVAATSYAACAGAGHFPGPGTLPAGYGSAVTAVGYWNGTAFGSACSPATDKGLQRVTLSLTAPGFAASENLKVVVRKPCESGC